MVWQRDLLRGLVYFAMVLAVGFFLGTMRVLWLVPAVGERTAEFIEAPLMLLAIALAARFVVRRFPGPGDAGFLLSGAGALALLLSVEFTVVLTLRGLTISEYLAQRDPVAGALYVFLLAVFALAPWFVARRSGQHGRA